MTPGAMDFRGPIKITVKSEPRANIIIKLEQCSNSNRVFCKQIGPLLRGGGLCI